MNITPNIRQVTDFSFTLSSQDLERYLADPELWAADVKAQLNGHGVGGLAPMSIAKTARRANGGGKRRQGKLKRRPAKANHPNGRGGLNRVRCPECQQAIASKYLSIHRLKKHGVAYGEPATASAAASSSTD